jgi:hypothetical protein
VGNQQIAVEIDEWLCFNEQKSEKVVIHRLEGGHFESFKYE